VNSKFTAISENVFDYVSGGKDSIYFKASLGVIRKGLS